MLLSIYIPTYERAQILSRTLSILVSAISNDCGIAEKVEIVVSDNASKDDTAGVVGFFQQYAEGKCRIIFQHNQRNIGALGNFLQASDYCRGEFIWLLGDDDIVLPHTLGKIMDEIDSYRPSMLFLGLVQDTDLAGSARSTLDKWQFFQHYPITSIGHISRLILRKELFERQISELKCYPDYFIWPLVKFPALLEGDDPIAIMGQPVIYPTKDGGMGIWTNKTSLARLAEFTFYCKMIARDRGELKSLHQINFPDKNFIVRKIFAASLYFPDQVAAFDSLEDLIADFDLSKSVRLKACVLLRRPASAPLRELLKRMISRMN